MEEKKAPARRAHQSAPKRPAATKPEAAAPKKRAPKPVVGKASRGDADRQAMVAMAAYFRAQKRGFAPGHEMEDWFAAEVEVAELAAPAAAKKPRTRIRKTPS